MEYKINNNKPVPFILRRARTNGAIVVSYGLCSILMDGTTRFKKSFLERGEGMFGRYGHAI